MTDEQARRLESIEGKLDKVRTEDLPNLRVYVAREISALKVKASIWGAAAGLIVSIGALLIAIAAR